jgi:hypothetical protein
LALMADLATIEAALRKADAAAQAGDPQAAKDAKVLADAYRAARDQAAPKPDYRGDGLAGTRLGAGIAGAADTLTLGFGDEGKAAGWAAIDALRGRGEFGENYDKRLAQERGMVDQMREENGGSYLAGQIGGALALPGAALKTGGSMAVNALRAGLSAGAQGGAYGFGNGEGDVASRARSAGDGAALGFAAGAAAPFVLKGLQGVATRRATNKAIDVAADAAPEPAALARQSGALYEKARKSGVVVDRNAMQPLLADLAGLDRLDADFTPDALKVIGRLQEKLDAGDLPLGELEMLHGKAGLAVNKNRIANPSDAGAAGAIAQKVDEFMMNLPDSAIVAGKADKGEAIETFREARSLWKQFRKSEKLQEVIANAEMKDNPALAIKNGFRSILSNKKKSATYSAAEIQVMRQVVDDTKAGSWVQRLIGYGTGLSRQVAATTAGYGLGGPIGAAVGSMAATKIGSMAKDAASDTAMASADRAARFVAGGGQFAQPGPSMLPGWGNALRAGSQIAAPVGVNALNR